jgi:hypothetical protein
MKREEGRGKKENIRKFLAPFPFQVQTDSYSFMTSEIAILD